ncbi:MAG: NifU family protein [Chloroflexi bacterium]|jgi:Fe-S cluster biogenesis protein NfuA|nr:NifU family protein [Anaerolineaceae bacterium]NLI44744.1 NifU family protein [Chloroflexota bacterium]HOE34993.1 NifU family protein [Anaerolineaceae bacterium]HOT25532.1 NifU family protein [Anaerolineaceae bacterium]HQK03424.1 NifU family protein [Anaerolineaceae bacterium]
MNSNQVSQFSKEEKIAGLIDQISAYIEQFHRGSVELVAIEGNLVKVRLGGACEGCALLPATLQGWVAGTIRQFFPEMFVESVE